MTYLYDIEIAACVRVHAKSEEEAREAIKRELECIELTSYELDSVSIPEASLIESAGLSLYGTSPDTSPANQ